MSKKMNEVTKILMAREGLTFEEAEEARKECAEALINGDYSAIEDYLELEDDYIFDVLGF